MTQSTATPPPPPDTTEGPPIPHRGATPRSSGLRRVAPFVLVFVLGLLLGGIVTGTWIVNRPTVIKNSEGANFDDYRQYALSLNQLHVDEKVCVIDLDDRTVERRTVRGVDGVLEQVTFNKNEEQPEDAFRYGLTVSGIPTFTVDFTNCPPGG